MTTITAHLDAAATFEKVAKALEARSARAKSRSRTTEARNLSTEARTNAARARNCRLAADKMIEAERVAHLARQSQQKLTDAQARLGAQETTTEKEQVGQDKPNCPICLGTSTGTAWEQAKHLTFHELAPKAPAITVADVEAAFGPAAAKMATKYDRWPDETIVRDRLAIIAAHGPRMAKRIIAAGARYESRARAEQYRRAFVH